MIDVNLGGEKSYPIADVLIRRKIPFAFATGNEDHGDRIDLAGRPVLRKPYLRADLTIVFQQLIATPPSLTIA